MTKYLEPIIEGKVYPTVSGGGYRVYIGGYWFDCDKNGKVKCQEVRRL